MATTYSNTPDFSPSFLQMDLGEKQKSNKNYPTKEKLPADTTQELGDNKFDLQRVQPSLLHLTSERR